MKSSIAVVLFATSLTALPALAQMNMKAGLWENSTKMSTADGKMEKAMAQMQQQMANMPAEQRKMMEDMMAKQGVNMNGPGGAITAKLCVTKEMIAQNHVPMQQKGNCTHNRSPIVGNSMHISFKCSSPESSGEGDVTFAGDTGYSMKMHVTSSGKMGDMTMESSAKWLGADCGNIKPIAMPKE